MMYTEYPELSDDMETATKQVERARSLIKQAGAEKAFKLVQKGRLPGNAVEVALEELAGEVEHIRESPEYEG